MAPRCLKRNPLISLGARPCRSGCRQPLALEGGAGQSARECGAPRPYCPAIGRPREQSDPVWEPTARPRDRATSRIPRSCCGSARFCTTASATTAPESIDSAEYARRLERAVAAERANTDAAASVLADEQRRRDEMAWREKAMRVEARIAAAYSSYVSALCREKIGGVPMVGSERTYSQARADFVAALSGANILSETARVAGIPRGWVSVSANYPDPLPVDVVPSTASNNMLAGYRCTNQ